MIFLTMTPNRSEWDLPSSRGIGILAFSLMFMMARDEFDALAPQREAAFFLWTLPAGHDVDTLRQDIDVPRAMLDKWLTAHDFEVSFRENLRRRVQLSQAGAGHLRWPSFPTNRCGRGCSRRKLQPANAP